MAIQKSKTLPNGVVGNYWKIVSTTLNRITLKCTYTISLFLDSSHSNGASLNYRKVYKFTLTQEESEGNLISLGYTKIIAKAETMIQPPFPMEENQEEVPFDSDLAFGETV